MDRPGALPGFAKLDQLARTLAEGGVRLVVAGDCAEKNQRRMIGKSNQALCTRSGVPGFSGKTCRDGV